MRVFSVPVSAPFLRCVIAAMIDGDLVEGFAARESLAIGGGDAPLELGALDFCRVAGLFRSVWVLRHQANM